MLLSATYKTGLLPKDYVATSLYLLWSNQTCRWDHGCVVGVLRWEVPTINNAAPVVRISSCGVSTLLSDWGMGSAAAAATITQIKTLIWFEPHRANFQAAAKERK